MKVSFAFECDDEEVKGIDNIVININRGSATVKSITYQTTSAPATSTDKAVKIPQPSNNIIPASTTSAPKISIPAVGSTSSTDDGVY